MRSITALFIISFGFLFGLKTGHADNGFGGFEVYRDITSFYCGKNFAENDSWKIDLWVVENAELALTIGPNIGKFAFGVGASLGENNQVTHLDADLNFKPVNNDHVKWSSYTLYRFGRVEGSKSKLFSRNRITPKNDGKDLPFGLLGDNAWVIGSDPVFFWGPYYDFGQMGIFKSTMLHFTFNLEEGGEPNFFVMLGF